MEHPTVIENWALNLEKENLILKSEIFRLAEALKDKSNKNYSKKE